MTAAETLDAELATLLGRAQALRTLAQALRPPDDLESLSEALEHWRGRASGALAEALERASRGLAAGRDILAEEHARLLSGHGGVAVREIVYTDPRHLAPTELADVAGFMAAFGLKPLSGPPDHVAAECELASWLALKEGYAASEGWSEPREVCRSAYERFFQGHLARWLVRFAMRLRAATVLDFHAAIADALELFVRGEAERLHIAPTETDPLAPLELLADDDVLGCAGCPGASAETS